MKDFIFANENDTFGLEFKTDYLDNFDNFTVHDIIFNEKDSDLTLEDIVRAGLNYERLPYTKAAFKKYAEDNNYKLTELDNIAQTSTTLNTPTALNITGTIKDGTPGVVDIQTLAIPATASATQGDYVIMTNWNGETLAAWLDIDADGTAPTGTLFVGADYTVKVPIVTDGTAEENAALFVAAINNDGNTYDVWTHYATIADATGGDVTVTQTRAGDVDAAVPKDDDDAGAGSITVTATQDGVDGVAEVQTITFPAFASATQGDFIILTNYKNETLAVWLNLDGDDTEPSGTLYVATDYQAQVDISTGDTAGEVGTLAYAAILAATDWSDYVTLVDGEDGTVEITQKEEGVVDDAVPKDAAEVVVGSITETEDTAGVDGNIYDELVTVVGGNTPYTYSLTTDGNTDLPAGLSFNTTTGKLEGVPTEAKADAVLDVTVTDVFGVEDSAELSFVIRTQS